ncbi:hypothetical protein RRG08_018000 [Elysia crispata]|uniref:Uncharacterized protein n=1 Tax=Elysia crispata TaxID=231223 RepID=A0AAE1DF44_9GAST|nr:hypothetical protein RRG08_018000 [Elysia crispata]
MGRKVRAGLGKGSHNTDLSFYRWVRPAEKANRFTFTSSDSGTERASDFARIERKCDGKMERMMDKGRKFREKSFSQGVKSQIN